MVAEHASATESVDQQNRDNGQNSLSLFSGAKRQKPRIIFLCSNISIPQLVTITRQCKRLFWVLAGYWVNVLPNCTMGLFWGRIWTRFPTLCRNGSFSFLKSTIKIILCPLNFCNSTIVFKSSWEDCIFQRPFENNNLCKRTANEVYYGGFENSLE